MEHKLVLHSGVTYTEEELCVLSELHGGAQVQENIQRNGGKVMLLKGKIWGKH
jgi:hypothetical protein